MPNVMEGILPLFCKTPPLFKLFHEFIAGNHPILMEENLIKISRKFKFAVFPVFHIFILWNTTKPYQRIKLRNSTCNNDGQPTIFALFVKEWKTPLI